MPETAKMSYTYDLRDEYPAHRRHHSPTYSDYSAGISEHSPTKDAGAVRVARKRYVSPDRRGHVEVYERESHRPRNRDYYYEEKRASSQPKHGSYDYDRRHHHKHSHHHSRSESRHSSSGPNWGQAAVVAASAGIIEAGLSRHDRDRTARVVTAAAGAGAIDAVAGKNNEKPHKSWEHIVGSTVGGLVIDRVAHGSRRH